MKRALLFCLTYALGISIALGVDAQVAPLPKEIKQNTQIPKEIKLLKSIKDEEPKVPTFIGPTKARPNQTILLDFSGDLGTDPKFVALPKPETFSVFKDFSGKLVILITPGDSLSGKTLLVVYADTKSNKTILATYNLDVTGEITPTPDNPDDKKPKPIKLKFFDDLKAAYLVSPNPAALDILTNIYKEIGDSQFVKRSDAAIVLKNICAKKLVDAQGKTDPTILRKVRDTVHTLLDNNVGTSDSSPFDLIVYKQFWTDIVKALAAVKAGQ